MDATVDLSDEDGRDGWERPNSRHDAIAVGWGSGVAQTATLERE